MDENLKSQIREDSLWLADAEIILEDRGTEALEAWIGGTVTDEQARHLLYMACVYIFEKHREESTD